MFHFGNICEPNMIHIYSLFCIMHIMLQAKTSRSRELVTESTADNSVIMFLNAARRESLDINAKDKLQRTPLHLAAVRGNEMGIKELLDCEGIAIEVSYTRARFYSYKHKLDFS